MAYDNTVTITGNMTRDPELRFSQTGMPIATFGMAWNRMRQDREEGDVSFFDVVCFRSLAENVAESLQKGMRVIVDGHLQHRRWESPEGETRSKVEIIANEVAPSLRWATADVRRNEYRGGGEEYRGGQETVGRNFGNRPAVGGGQAMSERSPMERRTPVHAGQSSTAATVPADEEPF